MTGIRSFLLSGLLLLLLAGCATAPPKDKGNVCSIFKEKSGWYDDTKDTYEKWGVPIPVQMSIIFQESGYDAKAKPPRRRLLWIIPWTRISSASGYTQALNETWDEYRDEAGGFFSSRADFGDSTDFIGWYIDRASRQLNIPKGDAYRQYLSYYVGPGGYKRGLHQRKPWLLKTARRVRNRAQTYKQQLAGCRWELEQDKGHWWWPF